MTMTDSRRMRFTDIFALAPLSVRVRAARRAARKRRKQEQKKPINPVINGAIGICVVLLRLLELIVWTPLGLILFGLDAACDRWGGKTVAMYAALTVIAVIGIAVFGPSIGDAQAAERAKRNAILAEIETEMADRWEFENLLQDLRQNGDIHYVASIYRDDNGELAVEFDQELQEERAFWAQVAADRKAEEEERAHIQHLLLTDDAFAEAYYLEQFPAYPNYEIPEVFTIGGGEFSADNINRNRYQNVVEFFAFWNARGLPRTAICGLAGNWFKEFSFYARENPAATNASHFGMWQISIPSELYDLYCNQYVDRSTLETQCQFAYDLITGKWDERITTNYGHIWDALVEAENAAAAAKVFSADFEKGGNTEDRMKYAEEMYEQTFYTILTPGP